MLQKKEFDAVVVGSGPNGLAAAITIQRAGLSVLLLEAKDRIGGGLRSQELTLPGYLHDVCSAIHPMAVAAPFFNSFDLSQTELRFVHPEFAAAHPFTDGTAAVLSGSLAQTARLLGADEAKYSKLIQPLVAHWETLVGEILAPLHIPENPLLLSRFGINAVKSAQQLAKIFKTREARGLFAGMAAHSIQPLNNFATSAIGLVLMAAGHTTGWPIPIGGSGSISKMLADYFLKLGGKIETNFHVHSLSQLPSSHAVLFDVKPKQLLTIAGHKFSAIYKWQLDRYRHGMGVFKVDWALDQAIPFTNEDCKTAGTIHLGNTFEEIAQSEQHTSKGGHPDLPFVLLSQPTMFDSSRAPAGKHIAWGYCHVPNGSTTDMTQAIENQVERFAPGFKKTIIARHTMNTREMENYNSNYIGGDINGGIMDVKQLFTRPALRWSPYKTSAKGIYLCSSSTPPGAGVHGMCGYHSAKKVLKDIFSISQ